MTIRIITEPSVYLIGAPDLVGGEGGLFDLLAELGAKSWDTDATTAAETLVEVGGRLCYESFRNPRPGGNAAYVGHILECGHGSVLEHATFTLVFTGVSRSLTHELVRHRAGFAYSQLSQRYVDESEAAFVVPPVIPADPDVRAYRVWFDACRDAVARYRGLTVELEDPSIADRTARRKAAREAARSVLPNCTETKIQVTANARAWRHFLELRGSRHADAEMRRLALAVLPVLRDAAPNLFAGYLLPEYEPGKVEITTPHRKV